MVVYLPTSVSTAGPGYERKAFKAAEENLSTCPNTLAEMLVPIFPDRQHYSTCWPGFCTVPRVFVH